MKESEDLNKLFYGEEASNKFNNFNNGLNEIEERHNQYFIERNLKLEINEKDRLHNHYFMITNAFGVTFGFLETSDLDEKIKFECHELFNKIFKNQL